MDNTIFTFPKPENEPVLGYKPGSAERKEIRSTKRLPPFVQLLGVKR